MPRKKLITFKLTGKLKTLVFLLPVSFFIFWGCRKRDSAPATLIWKGDKAIGISLPKEFVKKSSDLSAAEVQLVTTSDPGPLLGAFSEEGSRIVFTSLVPLTRGHEYKIFLRGELIGAIAVPPSDAKPPELISIYPTQDTVPANLLKIYLQFSSSMVEGNALAHLTLIRNSRDTMKGTFLDLSPELWNSDGTLLTLWLDPGRIKRDLIPNQRLGAPLEPFTDYSLRVSGKWKSKDGVEMGSGYVKNFRTLPRDERGPVPERWNMTIPVSGTSDALHIDLLQSLDYSLLNDAIRVLDSNHDPVKGRLMIGVEEKSIAFFPDDVWTAGEYILQVETRLEDLAGNNLNRPFDRDINAGKEPEEKKVVQRKFVVR